MMKRDNVDYEKITIEIPMSTYLAMKDYCYNSPVGRIFYCDFINRAILSYLKK